MDHNAVQAFCKVQCYNSWSPMFHFWKYKTIMYHSNRDPTNQTAKKLLFFHVLQLMNKGVIYQIFSAYFHCVLSPVHHRLKASHFVQNRASENRIEIGLKFPSFASSKLLLLKCCNPFAKYVLGESAFDMQSCLIF